MRIAVIGIGQSLRGDDVAGLEVVRLWQEKYPQSAARVRAELTELPGPGLLDLLEEIDAAILVDAVHSSAAPGTLIRIGPEELAAFAPDAGFAHGWGVAETLQLGRSLYPSLAACYVTLIGIVGKQFEMGVGLSQTVQEALLAAAQMLDREVCSLLQGKHGAIG